MQNFRSNRDRARVSSPDGAGCRNCCGSGASEAPLALLEGLTARTPPVVIGAGYRGELPALLMLPVRALLGSEFAGVGCSSADKLALFPPLAAAEGEPPLP